MKQHNYNIGSFEFKKEDLLNPSLIIALAVQLLIGNYIIMDFKNYPLLIDMQNINISSYATSIDLFLIGILAERFIVFVFLGFVLLVPFLIQKTRCFSTVVTLYLLVILPSFVITYLLFLYTTFSFNWDSVLAVINLRFGL